MTRQLISSGSPFEPRVGISRVNTIMQISRFVDSKWLVEFEADACLED